MIRRRSKAIALSAAVATLLSLASTIVSPSTALAAIETNLLAPPFDDSPSFGQQTLVLSNGNYVISDPDGGNSVGGGAVYLYNGLTDTIISTLSGSSYRDGVGTDFKEVGNGNFVVLSPEWNSGRGAVTWVNGTTGLNATVDSTNSLVGSTDYDHVGTSVRVLKNGNYVTWADYWHSDASTYLGAVTWGSGVGGVSGVVSAANSLVGTTTYDGLGLRVVELTNGNYVVGSPNWTNIATGAAHAGAATWGSGTSGVRGAVGATISLVGSTTGDYVGTAVTGLSNGNYVATTSSWDDGMVADKGAVTLANGTTGLSGTISTANSLVGGEGDLLSDAAGPGPAVVELSNGDFVVVSQFFKNQLGRPVGGVHLVHAAAATGVVTAANGLLGVTASSGQGDLYNATVTALSDGKYVVNSPDWQPAGATRRGYGAVTFVNPMSAGTTTLSNGIGTVTADNSLVGTKPGDPIATRVQVLKNGNYVVVSDRWDNSTATDAGAVTWGSGLTGVTGTISAANSLVGTQPYDLVGQNEFLSLANGNYVFASTNWNNGIASAAGAVTWASGTAPSSGPVNAANSFVGSTSDDYIAGDRSLVALANGNYVFRSRRWDNGSVADAGAATWGNGITGTSGALSAANSLVGTSTGDGESGRIVTLSNGNYVVKNPNWSNVQGAPIPQAGAVTLGNGLHGTAGIISAANSQVGPAASSSIGEEVAALTDGRYASWSQTFGDPATGIVVFTDATGARGTVTASDGAVGSDSVSIGSINPRPTARGAYLVIGLGGGSQQVRLVRPDWAPSFASTPPNVSATSATSSTPVTFATPVATDDRPGVATACLPASGSAFALGSTTVNCTATDTIGKTALTSFTVTVTAVDPTPVPLPLPLPVPVPVKLQTFAPLTPGRLADTRPAGETVDTLFARGGIRAAGSVLELDVAGRAGVASSATAVALNVTVVGPTSDGYVTVFPCGVAQPNASNLNFVAGTNVPNAVVAKIGSTGKVCIFTSARAHLIVDVNGTFPTGTTLNALTPARLLDSRPTGETTDGLQKAQDLRAAGTVTEVQVTGRAGVPTNASAAVLNVTVTGTTNAGFVTVFPCGATQPNTSNINFGTGATVANMVMAKIGTNGRVCIFTSAGTHVIADINGYFPAVTSFGPLNPARLLDTRPAGATVDGASERAGVRPAGTVTEVVVTGRGGVPAGAASVVLNVTAVDPTADGFASVYPCGITPPNASNLNYATGKTVANAVSVKIGAGGKVCIFSSSTTHLLADVNGSYLN